MLSAFALFFDFVSLWTLRNFSFSQYSSRGRCFLLRFTFCYTLNLIFLIIVYSLSGYNTPSPLQEKNVVYEIFFYFCDRFSLFITYFIYNISRLQYYITIVLYILITKYLISISHSDCVLLVLGIHTIYIIFYRNNWSSYIFVSIPALYNYIYVIICICICYNNYYN